MLLLVAHGSRRDESNAEVKALANQLLSAESGFADIDCAFLEIAQPSIPDGLRQLIAKGALEIVVMPYFLSAGRHVSSDIPAEIEQVRVEHPEINIRMAPYLGASAEIAQIVMQQASSVLQEI